MNRLTSGWRVGLLGVALAWIVVADVPAADRIWTGAAGDLQWGTALNWTNSIVPGTNDRAYFKSPYYATNAVIHLGDNRTIGELRFGGVGMGITGDGLYSLTLTNGNISKDTFYTLTKQTYMLDCDMVIGGNALWQHLASYGSSISVTGTVSDGGAGYGLTTDVDQNHNIYFYGPATYSGVTTVRCFTVTLSGAEGSLTNSEVRIDSSGIGWGNAFDSTLVLDNQVAANSNRFGDARIVRTFSNGGDLQLIGNATNPVAETVGGIALDSGAMVMRSDYKGTNVELLVKSITRQPGTALLIAYGLGTVGSNNRIRFQDETTNTNGMWHPWCLQAGGGFHVKVDANGCLVPFTVSDYQGLPASGASATVNYRCTNSLNMTAPQEVFGLRLDYNGLQTLDLGTNDLTVGSGSLLVSGKGPKTISSTGGRLIFGGNEVILGDNITSGGSSSNLIISAPIAATGAGDKYLCVADSLNKIVDLVALDGADAIGTYAGVYASLRTSGSQLRLGGPSNRTITGPLIGQFQLIKAGAGTLTLSGVDQRQPSYANVVDVKEGKLVIGSGATLSGASATSLNIRHGASLEVASGITWTGSFTAESNATMTGSCTYGSGAKLLAGARIAPGSSGIGTLTTGNLTLTNSVVIDWEVGNGTNTPGTDYDLLHVAGNMTFTTNTTMVISVTDRSAGATRVNGATFTVADWTGNDPSTNGVSWVVVNNSPHTLSTASATVQVSTTSNKIILSGIRSVINSGSAIFLR